MIHGWLVLDKPLGLSSMQATSRVKRLLSTRKAGHAGTLDPLASGVLPIALGKATKTINYMVDATKTYEFTVRWGEQTSTDDAEGEVLETSPHRPTYDSILSILPDFTGTVTQTPPAYSAIKINGQRAYKMARSGQDVQMPERQVEIYELELLEIKDQDHASFRCHCGKGTYIRSLGREMARQLGTCGRLSALRRTTVGAFTEKNAISLDFLDEMRDKDAIEDWILPIDAVLDDIPGLSLSEDDAQRFYHGQRVQTDQLTEEVAVKCYQPDGSLLGIGQMCEGKIKPVRMLDIHERRK